MSAERDEVSLTPSIHDYLLHNIEANANVNQEQLLNFVRENSGSSQLQEFTGPRPKLARQHASARHIGSSRTLSASQSLSTTASENRPIKKIHSSQKRSKAASTNVIKNLDSGVYSITKKNDRQERKTHNRVWGHSPHRRKAARHYKWRKRMRMYAYKDMDSPFFVLVASLVTVRKNQNFRSSANGNRISTPLTCRDSTTWLIRVCTHFMIPNIYHRILSSNGIAWTLWTIRNILVTNLHRNQVSSPRRSAAKK